ncbi:hypothetical protein ACJX0J_024419, partial [Zea mays]
AFVRSDVQIFLFNNHNMRCHGTMQRIYIISFVFSVNRILNQFIKVFTIYQSKIQRWVAFDIKEN